MSAPASLGALIFVSFCKRCVSKFHISHVYHQNHKNSKASLEIFFLLKKLRLRINIDLTYI